MLIETNFRSDKNNREILPMDQSGMPYLCMHTKLNKYMNKDFPWHWHSSFEIDYIKEGSLEFHTTDEIIHMKKGDAVFINSGIMHSYHAVSTENCSLYAHLFDMQFLSGMHNSILEQKYLFPILKSNNLPVLLIQPDNYQNVLMIEKILKLVMLSKEEPYGYEFEIRAELCRLWCLLLENTKEIRAQNIQRNNADVDRIKIMMQYIQEHYMERITLGQIAASANISSRECTRCFQRCIDNSPVNYLNDYRVRMAAQMLVQTGDSILTISENCGFSTSSYFGKVFHETMGCTPLEYRKNK